VRAVRREGDLDVEVQEQVPREVSQRPRLRPAMGLGAGSGSQSPQRWQSVRRLRKARIKPWIYDTALLVHSITRALQAALALCSPCPTAMNGMVANRNIWEMSPRRSFQHGCSPYQGLHARRAIVAVVSRSRAILRRPQNLFRFATFFIAVCPNACRVPQPGPRTHLSVSTTLMAWSLHEL
jgi:hypothetical protein